MIRILLGLLGLMALAVPATAQTLIVNVNGYTIGDDGGLQRFGAIEIGRDGRVVRTHPLNTSLIPPVTTRVVDGDGRTMLPGLIDAHGHVMGLGLSALQLDLSDTNSLAEAQAKIRDYAAANPGLPWIIGRGWNQEKWGLGRFPAAADLDAAVADRPVWLSRVDGHAGWANSAAMRAGNITPGTASPSGGRIERDASGRPSGIFVDAAEDLIGRHVPPPTQEFLDRALGEAQRQLFAVGVTTAADMGTSVADYRTMIRAIAAGRMRMRVLSYLSSSDPLWTADLRRPTEWTPDGHLRIVGIKIYSDGALGSRGAWLKEDYRDAPGNQGLGFLTDAGLRGQMEAAAGSGLQVAVHAIGDAANAQLLSAIEDLAQRFPGDRRWRVEHAQIVDPRDVPRFGRTGIIASMQPVHQTSDMVMAEARMGLPRLQGAYAWRGMLDAGARLAFGSDFPVESPNPFHGLAAAISRQDAAGRPPGGWLPAERLTIREALDAFTRTAAYAGFAEGTIGQLLPGRHADFIMIDRDVMAETDQRRVRGTQVLETWVGGERVWARQDAR